MKKVKMNKEEKKMNKKEIERLRREEAREATENDDDDNLEKENSDNEQSKKKKKKKEKKHKKEKLSNNTAEEDEKKKAKKEKKKNKKRKREVEEETQGSSPGDDHDDEKQEKKKAKKDKKKKSKKKKEKRQPKLEKTASSSSSSTSSEEEDKDLTKSEKRQKLMNAQQEAEAKAILQTPQNNKNGGGIVASSAIEFFDEQVIEKAAKVETAQSTFDLTLLLFYQYVEPVWDESTYTFMLHKLQEVGKELKLTGRMRVAREGLNCTLTGSHESIVEYCNTLKRLRPKDFENTEFKLTTNLPLAQKFPNLKVFQVVELVHYGLEGSKAPPIQKFHGTHLEPKDYHQKLGENNTVIIDVRNHYEAAIGRFVPPKEGNDTRDHDASEQQPQDPPKWLDPLMRKSTEFPAWLDKDETKQEMKGKQVLMYCTGGIRCERASALLKYKMETDPEIKALGIQGVYQLQGGIDKYFKEFPDGGYWKGKNYVFDKRFAHAPPKVDGNLHGRADTNNNDDNDKGDEKKTAKNASNTQQQQPEQNDQIMGKCEACSKPWDMYRGKRRCPTCGVPSLICRDCFIADKEGRKKLGKHVRCDLCVSQNITSKQEIRLKDEQDIRDYELKMKRKGLLKPDNVAIAPNPAKVTRLALKNMCRKNMDEAALLELVPGITHIVWKMERKSGKFLGQAWVEMKTPDDAARAVARDGKINPFGRPLYISFQPPDGKDSWPPPNSAVASSH